MDKKSYLSNLRVLLVEDDLDTLRQMEIMLRRRCGKVYTANNGKLELRRTKAWIRMYYYGFEDAADGRN